MSLIGRKLYLNWGNMILSIEKIQNTPENRKLLKIEELETEPHLLFDLHNILETRTETKLGNPVPEEVGGYEFQHYLVERRYWDDSAIKQRSSSDNEA